LKARTKKRRRQKKPPPRSVRIIKFIVSLLIIIGLGIYVLSLPIFDIKDVVVNGAQMLSADEIRALAAIPLSENLFFTKFARAEENLSKIHAIKEVRFYRIPPGTVLVSIKERKPIATLLFQKKSSVIDKDGYIINRNSNMTLNIPNRAELPVITGIKEKEAFKGNKVDKRVSYLISQVILKLSKYLESERMKLELGGLKNVSLILDDLLRVKLGETERVRRKMAVFVALLPEIAGKWSKVEYVDVRYPENPVIKYK
jgi:cell division protein FtsQ